MVIPPAVSGGVIKGRRRCSLHRGGPPAFAGFGEILDEFLFIYN
jgi:hypothetical protein